MALTDSAHAEDEAHRSVVELRRCQHGRRIAQRGALDRVLVGEASAQEQPTIVREFDRGVDARHHHGGVLLECGVQVMMAPVEARIDVVHRFVDSGFVEPEDPLDDRRGTRVAGADVLPAGDEQPGDHPRRVGSKLDTRIVNER